MDGLKIIIEVKEERISELEDRTIEITQSGKQKLDPPKSESEQSWGTSGTITKALIFVLSKSQNNSEELKKNSKNNGWKLSKFGKTNLEIQEAEQIKKATCRHIIINLLKTKEQQQKNLKSSQRKTTPHL